ncbi:serine carboxypeptidase, partial [Ostertagia ostertagi]
MRTLVLCLFVPLMSAAPELEQIKSLPNLVEPMRSKQYAGYVEVSPVKQLFYWYIESESNPANDPLVLFLNGGPGCSSLQGLFLEMGPFRVNNYGETVTRNPWTWNRYANIIYLDAPAGVGFSVRLDGLWNYTDTEVASDNYVALKEWFKKFPERRMNDFYAAGESYAGTYIPMLSSFLIDDLGINFKGMLIGNGCIDDILNFNSLVDFNYNHGFIDERYYRQSIEKCCNNTPDHCNFYGLSINETGFCYDEANYLNSANLYTGLDPYFIYYSCYLDSDDAPVSAGMASVTLHSHIRRKSFRPQLQPACAHHNDSVVYLQREDVRAALRIPDKVPAYETCNMDISNNYDFGPSHVLSQSENVKKVIDAGKSAALFYGDVDTLCNAVHGAQFAASLGLPEITPLRPYSDNEQLPPTIGFLTQYKGLDLLTVRGAGHFVAATNEKPKEALQIFVNFINKTSYDTPISHDIPYVAPSTTKPPSTTSGSMPTNWDAAPWLITSLPNFDEPLSSKHYSGYLSISETRKLFYWYIESENDPTKDPVVLWLNGGPGCSSLEGLFLEMGPFRAKNYGANILRNKWTWNRVASIIYLDAPAGVGFSVDLNSTAHVFTDDEVAHDNLLAITEWFKKFPERQRNDFYVAGESYGGTFVPMLSALLLKDFPQFKGMLIGNGCMDERLLYNSLVGYNYDHTFIDESQYRSSLSLNQANFLTGLDPFFLYYTCRLDEPDATSNQRSTALNTHLRKFGNHEVACAHYNDSTVYLQRADVRRALNIPSIVPKYESCNEDIENTYDVTITHYITQHDNVKQVIAANKKVALFYGDVDSVCNAIHGAQFASELGLKLISPQSIYTDQQQKPPTIGFITKYEGLDFLTVRGAGHFVASSDEKPKEALQLFVNFLRGTNYSTPIDYVSPTSPPSTIPTPSSCPTTSSSTTSPSLQYLQLPLVLLSLMPLIN